jgi:hypothetical protein
VISAAIDLISGLSLQQLGLGALGLGITAWFAATKAVAWIRTMLLQYTLKKLAAVGLLGTIGTELIPGLDVIGPLLDLVSGVIPL